MVIKTVKKISIIEEGVYKVNSVFSSHQLTHATNFIKGIIVDPKASILRISQLFGEKNHSNLNKFFSKNWWDETNVNKKRIFEFINKNDCHVLISDDSDNVKRGKKMKGVSQFKRHDGDGFERAHCKVISGMANQRGEFMPLFTTLYLKEKDAEREGIPFKTKTEIVKEHNIKTRELEIDFYSHIYDSAYFCNNLIEHSESKEYIVSILSGRNDIFIDGKKWKLSNFKKRIDKRKMLVIGVGNRRIRYLEFNAKLTSGKEVKLVAFIDDDAKRIKLLVSTNLNWSVKRLFQEYSKRQSIEVYFRDCKQELSWGNCSFRELKPQAKWDTLVMLAYSILKNFIKTKYAFKREIKTIGNIVDYIREKTELHSLFIKCKT
jgi:hypothetical protein